MARLLLVLALSVALSSCRWFQKKTDEDKLKEQVDSSSVHLYLAAKLTLDPRETSTEVQSAREGMTKLFQLGVRRAEPTGTLSSKDAAALAVLLWKARGLGRQVLLDNRPERPAPILGFLLARLDGADALTLNPQVEHGLLLTGFTLLKLHAKSPVPVPPEILLYEAWQTEPDKVPLPGLIPLLHGIKSYVYAGQMLCDLAEQEAEASSRLAPGSPSLPDAGSGGLAAAMLAFDATALPEARASVEGVANGSTAICYLQRDEPDKGNKALGKFLKNVEDAGLRSPETQFLNGYFQCAEGDVSRGKELLNQLIATSTDKELVSASRTLAEMCGSSRGGKLAKAFDRAMFAKALARIAFDRLERSGVLKTLEQSSAMRAVREFTHNVSTVVAHAQENVPTFESVKARGKSLLSRE